MTSTIIERGAGATRPDLTAGATYDVAIVPTCQSVPARCVSAGCTCAVFTARFIEWQEDDRVSIWDNGMAINGWEFEALLRP